MGRMIDVEINVGDSKVQSGYLYLRNGNLTGAKTKEHSPHICGGTLTMQIRPRGREVKN